VVEVRCPEVSSQVAHHLLYNPFVVALEDPERGGKMKRRGKKKREERWRSNLDAVFCIAFRRDSVLRDQGGRKRLGKKKERTAPRSILLFSPTFVRTPRGYKKKKKKSVFASALY